MLLEWWNPVGYSIAIFFSRVRYAQLVGNKTPTAHIQVLCAAGFALDRQTERETEGFQKGSMTTLKKQDMTAETLSCWSVLSLSAVDMEERRKKQRANAVKEQWKVQK